MKYLFLKEMPSQPLQEVFGRSEQRRLKTFFEKMQNTQSEKSMKRLQQA